MLLANGRFCLTTAVRRRRNRRPRTERGRFPSAEIEKMPKLSFPGDDSLRSYATGVAQLMQSVTDMEVQPTGWPVTEPLESHAYIITLVVDQQNANQALSIVRKYASIVN